MSQYLTPENGRSWRVIFILSMPAGSASRSLDQVNTSLLHVIEKKKSPAVCINDSQKVEVYDRVKRELKRSIFKSFSEKEFL